MVFYRSVFWLFSTAGHGGFLPGESQFATPSLCEGPNNLDRHYFLTTTAAYLLVPLNMLVQEQGGQIASFPAVPVSWREVAFHGIPAAGGRRVQRSHGERGDRTGPRTA